MASLNAKTFNPLVRKSNSQGKIGAYSSNGNLQWAKPTALKFYQLLVASIFNKDEDAYNNGSQIRELRSLIRQLITSDKTFGVSFVYNAILFARTEVGMRSLPIIATVELASELRATNQVFPAMRSLVANVISRADELTDLYAYALTVFGTKNKVPLAIKRGIADAFLKFDAYQLAKYNRDGVKVTLARLLKIVHPTATSVEQQVAWKAIVNGTLAPPATWEVALSENGNLPIGLRKTPAKLWADILAVEGSGHLPYMAALRNVRNIMTSDQTAVAANMLISKLTNKKLIEKSRQLPWAYITAYDEAKNSGIPHNVLNAIGFAMDHSVVNIPKFGERTWVILDVSGSMNTGSGSSKMPPVKIGALVAATLFKQAALTGQNAALTIFSDNAKTLKNLNPLDSTFTLVKQIESQVYGGGTNLEAALAEKSKLGFDPDTVIVISDMQVNRLSYSGTHALASLNSAYKIAVNLTPSVSTPLPAQDGWMQLSGWSPRMFQFISLDRKKDTMIQTLSTPVAMLEDAVKQPQNHVRPLSSSWNDDKASKAKKKNLTVRGILIPSVKS